MKKILINWLKSPVFLIIILVLSSNNYWYGYVKHRPKRQFFSDVDQYYSYLPGALVHGDLNFNYPQNYWLKPTPTGKKVPKGTMGMSIMYLPSFLVGHTVATIQDRYEADGYSKPYTRANRIGSLLYVFLGVYLLFKSLLYFGSRLAAYLATIAIFFATNLFFYSTGLSEMPHSYLFFLFSFVIFQTIRWHEDKKAKRIYYLALVGGLCALIRPTDGIIVLFPLLYGIKDKASFIEKWNLLLEHRITILKGALLFFVPILPQLIFWKIQTGQFLFFSYGGNEGFYFNNPQPIKVLFSFRNGLYSYAPILLFATVGLFMLRKKHKHVILPVAFILLLNLYIISSWWTWWFGGAFGMRAMVQYFPFFAMGFVVLFDRMLNKKAFKVIIPVVIVLFSTLNIIQTIQYNRAIIHWDGMNYKVYKMVFCRFRFTKEESKWFNENITKIDYRKAELGDDQHVW